MEEGGNAFNILTVKPTRKRPIGRSRVDGKEIGVNMRNWVDSAKDMNYWRVHVNAALNLQLS